MRTYLRTCVRSLSRSRVYESSYPASFRSTTDNNVFAQCRGEPDFTPAITYELGSRGPVVTLLGRVLAAPLYIDFLRMRYTHSASERKNERASVLVASRESFPMREKETAGAGGTLSIEKRSRGCTAAAPWLPPMLTTQHEEIVLLEPRGTHRHRKTIRGELIREIDANASEHDRKVFVVQHHRRSDQTLC